MKLFVIDGERVRTVIARKPKLMFRYVRWESGIIEIYVNTDNPERFRPFIEALAREKHPSVINAIVRGIIREFGDGKYRVVYRDEDFGEEVISVSLDEEKREMWGFGRRTVIEVYRLD